MVKGARLCRCSKQDSRSPELLFMLARGPGSAGLAQPANVIRQATPAGPITSAQLPSPQVPGWSVA